MAGTKELVERLNGENPDKVVATDRLRMFAYDPDTFEFDQHDALSLIPTIEEAADALERLERERDEAKQMYAREGRKALVLLEEAATLRARVAKMEEALRDVMFLAEADHVCLLLWNKTGSGANYEEIMAHAKVALTEEQP